MCNNEIHWIFRAYREFEQRFSIEFNKWNYRISKFVHIENISKWNSQWHRCNLLLWLHPSSISCQWLMVSHFCLCPTPYFTACNRCLTVAHAWSAWTNEVQIYSSLTIIPNSRPSTFIRKRLNIFPLLLRRQYFTNHCIAYVYTMYRYGVIVTQLYMGRFTIEH